MDVFQAADNAKIAITNFLTNSLYSDFSASYTLDLSEVIKEDYVQLSKSALQTIIFVFLAMLFFV
ncbi:MAG: hypothetical protein Q8O99_04700 [bacterium]|nr:hypothetical protein [bacterium]